MVRVRAPSTRLALTRSSPRRAFVPYISSASPRPVAREQRAVFQLFPHTNLTWAVIRSAIRTATKAKAMSDYSGSPPDYRHDPLPQKRKGIQAGLDGHPTGRSVKRRASKACQCCRARKVRCNVTEHGAPCTNCRLDEVDCIVSESRRKK